MAIIVNKKTKALIDPTETHTVEGLVRTVVIKINNDGSVQAPSPVDLGYVGDHKATYINIDTSGLIWNRLPEHKPPLGDVYKPILTFRQGDFIKSIESDDGNLFYVPREVTEHPGGFSMSYSLVERTTDAETYQGNVGKENAEEYTEVFISQPFNGLVKEVGFTADEYTEHIDLEESVLVVGTNLIALQKPEVQFTWDGSVLTPSNKYIGYVGDRLITPLSFINFPKQTTTAKIILFFSNGNIKYKATFENITTPLKCWLPAELTNAANNPSSVNNWQIAAKLEVGDAVAYTPFCQVSVLFSVVPEDEELQEIYTTLYDANSQALIDEDGNSLEVLDTNGGSVRLNYTGPEIDSMIGWIYSNKNSITDHIGNSDIHVTAEDKTKWNSLDARLTAAEEQIEGFDTDVIGAIETNAAAIETINSTLETVDKDLRALEATDTNLNGRINLVVGRVDVAERNIAKNTEDIAGVYSEVSSLNNGVINLLDAEKEARIAEDVRLTAADEALSQRIASTNTSLEGLTNDLVKEANDRITADTNLSNRISTNTNSISSNTTEINNIKNDNTIIRNDAATAQAFVAKIIFLSSEAEYQALVDEGKIEANTLYLIQEEEE